MCESAEGHRKKDNFYLNSFFFKKLPKEIEIFIFETDIPKHRFVHLSFLSMPNSPHIIK